MDGVSSTLGVMDSDERMVNELEKEGSGDVEEEAVMVCEGLSDGVGDCVDVEEPDEGIVEVEEPEEVSVELGDPAGDTVGLSEGNEVIEEDEEGPGVGDMVLDKEGWGVNEAEEDGRIERVIVPEDPVA